MCVDYKALNKVTIKNKYPISLVKTVRTDVQGDIFQEARFALRILASAHSY